MAAARVPPRFGWVMLSLLLITPGPARSQSVGYYTPALAPAAFSSVAGFGASVTGWLNGTNTDDNRSAPQPIGFDFWYMGDPRTTFQVSLNGFVDFSGSSADGSGTGSYGRDNAVFSSNGSPTLLTLAPLYDDLVIPGNPGTQAALDAAIKYFVSGPVGDRVLTIEWTNMRIKGGVTGSLQFQVKLSEADGRIRFAYGTMTSGGTPSYSCGLTGEKMFSIPTPTDLLTQQTAGTATFSYAPQDGLSTLPLAGYALSFDAQYTAPPAAPVITALTRDGPFALHLEWEDQSTTETFFRIERRAAGEVEWTVVADAFSGLPASTGSVHAYPVPGLSPDVMYEVRVGARNEVTAGSWSSSSSQDTDPSGVYSVSSGLWSDPATWSTGMVPTSADTVTIQEADDVTVDENAACAALVLGDVSDWAPDLFFHTVQACTLTVAGDAVVKHNAAIAAPGSGTQKLHLLAIGGDLRLEGDGVFDGSRNSGATALGLAFRGGGRSRIYNVAVPAAASSMAPAGAFWVDLSRLVVDKDAADDTVYFELSAFAADDGVSPDNAFVALRKGTLAIQGSAGYSGVLFESNAYEIPAQAGLVLDNPAFAITPHSVGDLIVRGSLVVHAIDELEIGDASGEDLLFHEGARFELESGNVFVAGGFGMLDETESMQFSMSGGQLLVAAQGGADRRAFDLGASQQATFAGGTIVLAQETVNHHGWRVHAPAGVFTGTTLEVGYPFYPDGMLIAEGDLPPTALEAGMELKLESQLEHVVHGGITVPSGSTLAFMPGSSLWVEGGFLDVDGALSFPASPSCSLGFRNPAVGGALPSILTGSGSAGSNPLGAFRVADPEGVYVTAGFGIATRRLELLEGGLDPGLLAVGDGIHAASIRVEGGSLLSTAEIDTTAGLTLEYELAQPRFTGHEVPASRMVDTLRVEGGIGRLTLSGGDLGVRDRLELDGVIASLSTSMLRLNEAEIVPYDAFPSSEAGCVEGPLQRTVPAGAVDAELVFPVGRDSVLRALRLESVDVGGTEASLVAQMLRAPFTPLALPLDRFSGPYGWQVEGLAGVGSDVRVRLAFADLDAPWSLIQARVVSSPAYLGPYVSRGGSAAGTTGAGSIVSTQDLAAGDAYFSIAEEGPSVRITTPNGGESLVLGQVTTANVQVLGRSPVAWKRLYLSTVGSAGPWTAISTELPDSVQYHWIPTGAPDATVWLRVVVEDELGRISEDISDAPFELIQSVLGVPEPVSNGLDLAPPHPNPARGAVSLRFVTVEAAPVRLEVCDPAGRRVALLADGDLPAGTHEFGWGSAARPGVYFARLSTPQGSVTRRFVRLD